MKVFPPNIRELLYLADTALILGHRNSEWTGHGPILEQDIAISNIALDLIGQARNFYQLAAAELNSMQDYKTTVIHTEDTLAYLRDTRHYYNLLIVEQPRGDWAMTTLRQFLVSSFQQLYYEQLLGGSNRQLAGIAEKSLKEIRYHKKWSGEWVIRLGDGTEESRKRLLQALEILWRYTGEFFEPADFENRSETDLPGFETSSEINMSTLPRPGIDKSQWDNWSEIDLVSLRESWMRTIETVMAQSTILEEWKAISSINKFQSGGKSGLHTEHLGYILAEMQFLQRAYPGCEW